MFFNTFIRIKYPSLPVFSQPKWSWNFATPISLNWKNHWKKMAVRWQPMTATKNLYVWFLRPFPKVTLHQFYIFVFRIFTLFFAFPPQEILREEIRILQEKVEHHPDVTRFAMENLELRGFTLISIEVSFEVYFSSFSKRDFYLFSSRVKSSTFKHRGTLRSLLRPEQDEILCHAVGKKIAGFFKHAWKWGPGEEPFEFIAESRSF